MIHADFARSLSLLRQEKGISQRQAARALGIGRNTLYAKLRKIDPEA